MADGQFLYGVSGLTSFGFTDSGVATAVSGRVIQSSQTVAAGAASIQQMRELMLQLGCVEAVNLDGGASTALAYQGKIVRAPGRQLTTTLQVIVK